ncbi:alpha/beta fold hydrolase [Chloroflexota bacterium]
MDSASELSKNYTVYLPNMPGFGFSQPLVGDYYLPDLVEFVDNFADTLGLVSFVW